MENAWNNRGGNPELRRLHLPQPPSPVCLVCICPVSRLPLAILSPNTSLTANSTILKRDCPRPQLPTPQIQSRNNAWKKKRNEIHASRSICFELLENREPGVRKVPEESRVTAKLGSLKFVPTLVTRAQTGKQIVESRHYSPWTHQPRVADWSQSNHVSVFFLLRRPLNAGRAHFMIRHLFQHAHKVAEILG